MNPEDNNLNESTQSAQDQLLSDILQRFSQNNPTPQQSPPQSTDIFSSLLSNTDLISKLPQIVSAVKPILDLLAKPQAHASEQAKPTTNDTAALPAHPAAAARAKSDADRTALLCAMKPYLSKDRQNAIDYIIKLSRLGDILKTL